MKRTNVEPPPSPVPSSPPSSPTETPKELPEWFELKPFQYNGRVFIASLPGLYLALVLGGELLLGVVVLGGLLIHFMQSGGARRRAVLAFLCVFITAQMATIYSALPLVWESVYNVITILLLNMSVVLMGGWSLIQFEEFLKEEPPLAEMIEMSLFAIFPIVSVALTCCLLAMLTSSQYVPYSIVVHGFLLLRFFVTPSLPSFRKKNFGSSSSSRAFVLGHAEVSLLLILYVSSPVEFFIIRNVWSLLSLITVVELLFLFVSPCFLLTLLELRTWTDCYGIPYKYIIWLRWASGLAVLFLGSVLLSFKQDSILIPWLSLTVLSNVLFGWTAAQKGQISQTFKYVCSFAVVLIYVLAVQYGIPWHLTLHNIDLANLGFVLTSNAILSVACFLVCSHRNRKLTSTLLIAFLGVMVYTEAFLYRHGLYSYPLMLCTGVSSTYLLVRLVSAGLVGWQCVWVGAALHAFKVPFFLEMLTTEHSESSGSFSAVALTMAVTKLICFEWQPEVSNRSALGYIFAILVCLLLSYQGLLHPLMYILNDSTPTLLQTVCIIIALTSIVCLKLTTQHLRHLPVAHKLNMLVLVSTGLAFVLQPSGELTQQNVSNWLSLISCTLAVAILLGITSPDQSPFAVFSESTTFGLATGLRASELLFAMPSKLTVLQYTLSCMACSFILLSLWVCFKAKRPVAKQPFLKPAVCFLAIVGTMTYITEVSQATEVSPTLVEGFLMPCLRLYCAITIVVGLSLRFYCLFVQSRDPFGFAPSQVATISNLMTILGSVLACMNCPIEPWEIWNLGCALLLLNLQQDPDLLTSLTPKRRTGIVIAACLFNVYSAAVMRSDLQAGISLYPLLEAALLLAVLPVLITFTQHQLLTDHSLNTELVIFLTPLNVLFFLIGSSYTSWLLGGIGLGAGLWMLSERLALKELM